MVPIKEIGECLVTSGEHDYFFRPSFTNMMRIGEPQEIVRAFADLHDDELTQLIKRATAAYGFIPIWLAKHMRSGMYEKKSLMTAINVLEACSDQDITELVGDFLPAKTQGKTFKRRLGKLSDVEILIIARSLITHGIIGKAKVRQLQRNESETATNQFSAFEYISAARNHFGMSRDEAQQLTMTEFLLMLNAKYPEQKGYTREEYDGAADDYFARKAKRIANAKQQKP
ncbi:DUF6246 family protein [Pantoea sp. Marseille-Q5743]|uniref:DUF6246 family protein n=1 Tax=Pantoea sp. Marseille-Q5743 TaxID=2972776 RepID=UPI0021CA189F|nr:DUF6246 family protein [Pantoea sp. Marseille-Q5743]